MENEIIQINSMWIENAIKVYQEFVDFTSKILKKWQDFWEIPGISKPSLLKPGAEKLRLFYWLWVELTRTSETMDIEKDFYDVTYKVSIKDKKWTIISECEGSCNTYEENYRYKWEKKPKPSSDMEEKLKSEWNWRNRKYDWGWQRQERTENQNKISKKNTIQKMAQKRAYVWAMLNATAASEFYTQDVEDIIDFTNAVDKTTTTTNSTPSTPSGTWSIEPITQKQQDFLWSIISRHKFDQNPVDILEKMIKKYCPGKTIESLSKNDWSLLIAKAQIKSDLVSDLKLDEMSFGSEVQDVPFDKIEAPKSQVSLPDDDLPF